MLRTVFVLAALTPVNYGQVQISRERLQCSLQAKSQRTQTVCNDGSCSHQNLLDPLRVLTLLLLRLDTTAAFDPCVQPASHLRPRLARTSHSGISMWEKTKFVQVGSKEKSTDSATKTKAKSTTKTKAKSKAKATSKPIPADGSRAEWNSMAKAAKKLSKVELAPSSDHESSAKPGKSKKKTLKQHIKNKKAERIKNAWQMLLYDRTVPESKKEKKVQLEVPRSLISMPVDAPKPKWSKFSELPVNPAVLRVLRDVYGYDSMTPVQASSISPALQGLDVLAKSKTGTGKTFAFLIPAIERALRFPAEGAGVSVLVLSPTRTLALQTAEEAKKLTQFLDPPLFIEVVTGGESMQSQAVQLEAQPPDLLVATPGRLDDIMKVNKAFCDGARGVVLDEADRLLDPENRNSVQKILKRLPSKASRQTLMFSATFADEIKAVASQFMRPERTVAVDLAKAEDTLETHDNVPQDVVVTSLKQQLAAVMRGVRQAHMAGGKVLVFLPTARQATFFASTYNFLGEQLAAWGEEPLHAIELQSKQTQTQRTTYSEEFRRNGTAVVFASDLAARGMDFPDVTLIVQVGAPKTRDLYIHRIGRTARAGKSGAGLLYLADYERHLLKSKLLGGLPLTDQSKDSLYLPDPAFESDIDAAVEKVKKYNTQTGKRVYHAFLAHHLTMLSELKWSNDQAIMTSNQFATECLMLPRLPLLEEETVKKMGLMNAYGLRVEGTEYKGSKSIVGKGFGYDPDE